GIMDDRCVGTYCYSSERGRFTHRDDDFMKDKQCDDYFDNRRNNVLILYYNKIRALIFGDSTRLKTQGCGWHVSWLNPPGL
ncbi:MAG: hypothetical protein EZS28_049666, partial [Streblomastix strix]